MRIALLAGVVAGLVIVLALPVPAEQGGQPGSGPLPLDGSYTLTLLGGSGDYTRSERCDLNGDGQEDIVFLSGERLDVLFAPGIHEALVTDLANPTTQGHLTKDFAILREPGGQDRIVLVDDTGLVTLDVNASSTPYVVQRQELGDFQSAGRLDAWSDRSGNHWVAGTHTNGGTLYTADCKQGLWTLNPPIPTNSTAPAIDLVLFDDDGDELDPMVVFLLSVGWGTFDPWGTRVPEFNSGPNITYTDIARLRRGGAEDADGLVFLGDVPSGPFLISMVEGATSSFQLLPADEQFYAVTTGRYDLDTQDDLLLAGKGSEKLFVVLDDAAGPGQLPDFDFDPESYHKYDAEAGDAAFQEALPLIVDVDHDGDGDPTVAMEDNERFWVGRNATFDAYSMMATLVEDAHTPVGHDPEDPPVAGHLYYTDAGGGEYDFWIEFDVDIPAVPPGPYLDVMTYRSTGGSPKILAYPVDSQRIPTAGLGGTTLTVTLSPDEFGEAFVDDEWVHQLYTIFQFVEAPSVSLPQTWCYPACAIVYAPDEFSYFPPHPGTPTFEIAKTLPTQGLPAPGGGGPIPNGNGDDTDCVPSNKPPSRM